VRDCRMQTFTALPCTGLYGVNRPGFHRGAHARVLSPDRRVKGRWSSLVSCFQPGELRCRCSIESPLTRNASMPRDATLLSCASECPDRLENTGGWTNRSLPGPSGTLPVTNTLKTR
jgi:hypothetical protein